MVRFRVRSVSDLFTGVPQGAFNLWLQIGVFQKLELQIYIHLESQRCETIIWSSETTEVQSSEELMIL